MTSRGGNTRGQSPHRPADADRMKAAPARPDTEAFSGTRVERRPLLLVENEHLQAEALMSRIEKTGLWSVEWVASAETARVRLGLDDDRRVAQPALVSIDLGLGSSRDHPDEGLALMEEIRERWTSLALVMHSSIVRAIVPALVRRVLAQSVSYFYLGGGDNDIKTYTDMLSLVALGYHVVSPFPASKIREAMAMKPDPFNGRDEFWDTLEWLDKGYTHKQIAAKRGESESAVKARIKRMADALRTLDEAPDGDVDEDAVSDSQHKEFLTKWFRNNRFRRQRRRPRP